MDRTVNCGEENTPVSIKSKTAYAITITECIINRAFYYSYSEYYLLIISSSEELRTGEPYYHGLF